MAKSDTIRVALLGYEGCSAWISAGVLEFFAIANLVARARGVPTRFECLTVSAARTSVRASHGVRLQSHPLGRRYHAMLVPPLWAEGRSDFAERAAKLMKLVPFTRSLARRSEIVASACSGGVLLAQAGLLDGYRTTICWWLADWFAERFPQVALDATKLVVTDRTCWTSAAGTAYLHLCLALVEELGGAPLARATARLALVEPKRGSQSPFLDQRAGGEPKSPELQRAVELIERTPWRRTDVGTLARKLGMTERTLNRRFRAELGVSPLAYLQTRRIALAKKLLEEGTFSFERIVERCGYTDTASFRKLFAREVGMTPREYRSRFGS